MEGKGGALTVQGNETIFTMEATLAILDIPEQRVKTGISHQYLRPDRGVVDPCSR
jgi:hypothetical protein